MRIKRLHFFMSFKAIKANLYENDLRSILFQTVNKN